MEESNNSAPNQPGSNNNTNSRQVNSKKRQECTKESDVNHQSVSTSNLSNQTNAQSSMNRDNSGNQNIHQNSLASKKQPKPEQIDPRDQDLLNKFFSSANLNDNSDDFQPQDKTKASQNGLSQESQMNRIQSKLNFSQNPFTQEPFDQERVKIIEFKLLEANPSIKNSQSSKEEEKQGVSGMRNQEITEQMMIERMLNTEKGSSTLELSSISEDMLKNYNDGKRIFVNRLRFYNDKAIEEHMISFKQLMYKDLGFKNKLKGKSSIQRAILSTMVFDIELITQLLDEKIPMTIFLDRDKDDKGPQVLYEEKLNLNFVFQQKWGGNSYSVFHSKLILYEFDDRLRVIVTSANLYTQDWELLSNVTWFQDFFKAELGKNNEISQSSTTQSVKVATKEERKNPFNFNEQRPQQQQQPFQNDFKQYLKDYLEVIIPKNVKVREVFRQKIDLDKFDFSTANAFLIASINGRHADREFKKYGQARLGELVRNVDKQHEKTITYQTSSIGKLNTKFMTSMYNQFGKSKKVSEDIHQNFRVIFPTIGYVSTSHLGPENASSIILQESYWYDTPGFPRKSFYRQVGKSKLLDKNLYHTKFMIITDKGKESEITDDTVLYFGSHNFSGGAWGNLEKNDSQISISNWELGVVFGPQVGSQEMKQKMINNMVLQYPPEKYQENDHPFMRR
eukprot:403372152